MAAIMKIYQKIIILFALLLCILILSACDNSSDAPYWIMTPDSNLSFLEERFISEGWEILSDQSGEEIGIVAQLLPANVNYLDPDALIYRHIASVTFFQTEKEAIEGFARVIDAIDNILLTLPEEYRNYFHYATAINDHIISIWFRTKITVGHLSR